MFTSMFIRKCLMILICAVMFIAAPASAGPNSNAALSAARIAAKKQADFKKTFRKLSAANKAKVKAAMVRKSSQFGADDDSDGLPDIYEDADGSNSCSSDSDQDGRPDNEDSDESEGEYKGNVTSYSSSTLVVAGATISVTDTTRFEGLVEGDLAPGVCIKVEGKLVSGSLTATKIEAEDDCN